MIKPIVKEVVVEGQSIKFEFNKFAKQANGSVMVSSGATQVLVTVCSAQGSGKSLDFFPLGVDYIEKSYSVGKVPGGYNKREGRSTDVATLNARAIDRPLRPCFPEDFSDETVITATVMSYESCNSPVPLALVGASVALMISDIPFNGPVAMLRVSLKNGEYHFNPLEGSDDSDLDLTIACSENAVLMVEAGANFLSEAQMIDAIKTAHEKMKPLFEMQKEIQKEIGKEKWIVTPKMNAALKTEVSGQFQAKVREAFSIRAKSDRYKALADIKAALHMKYPEQEKQVDIVFESLKSDVMRQMILKDRTRIDGRGLEDIRPISCEVGVLKKTHGSALFTRGETQSLGSVTLASAEDMQRVDTLYDADHRERFMLHYNFPPFSVGEARMQRAPGRREIGHGALAYRAVSKVIPPLKDFTYTIRAVCETLESNGSSSMASVCSSTMALLNAGVPLKESVAGIAMGLILEQNESAILSDILGDEDHLGDMDFKVCGTKEGITALQMDIKIPGITQALLEQALAQAKRGREHILNKMAEVITETAELSDNAPRVFKIKIKPEKIRDIIGPGGKNIKKIAADTNAKIDVQDSGIISIMAPDAVSAQAAKSMIRSFITSPQIGDVVLGRVVKLTEFGVFVELKPGVDGLCHISQLDEHRVDDPASICKMEDEILVKIIDVDKQGRIKLSRKDAFGLKPTA